MAASSPAKTVSADVSVAAMNHLSSNSGKSLRGLNKPKCIKCGNVARSRCPYQSCKSCCAKAQNPCHIHVLKGNSSFPEKIPSSSSPQLDQQSTEVSHSGRLRQLSNNFAQFSNVNAPFRSRKPLTRKDAQVINEWRFLKMKEFKRQGIETENEAFDRYTRNAGLLGEVFSVNSEHDNQFQEEQQRSEVNASSEENTGRTLNVLKSMLRSNPVRTNNFRKKIHYIVDQGLNKLGQSELNNDAGDLEISKDIDSCEADQFPAPSDLVDKMNQVRNEEDLKACWESASQMFGWCHKTSLIESGEFPLLIKQDGKSDSSQEQHPLYSLPNWVSPVDIDQESLSRIDTQFSALENL